MTYVISDIHGQFNSFLKMLKEIDFKETDTLYILGDVIDRGPGGIQCLKYIMKQPNMHMLIGNHEYMMLDTLKSPELKFFRRSWYNNGGEITEKQYYALSEDDQKEIFDYVNTLPGCFDITVNDQRFILAHARPEAKYYGKTYSPINGFENETEFIVWDRNLPDAIKDTVIVFGHTPTFHYVNPATIITYNNTRYNIDCGAAYPLKGGKLGCMRLDDLKGFYAEINDIKTN